jgi:hypothetical protein
MTFKHDRSMIGVNAGIRFAFAGGVKNRRP